MPGPYVLNKTVSFCDRLDRDRLRDLHLHRVPAACPTAPSRGANFNYSIIAVVAVIGFAFIWWIAGARKWFKGPKIQGTPEELAEIERDLTII